MKPNVRIAFAKHWSTLTAVDYRITCERCLKPYDFPQAGLREHNRNWTYRVVGPFRCGTMAEARIARFWRCACLIAVRLASGRMTFATAMNLSFDGIQREVDFIAWHGEPPPEKNIGLLS